MELTGERLQKACWLVATGLKNEEIAKYLRVKVGTIRRCRRDAAFIQMVAKMQAIADEHMPGLLQARASHLKRAQ